jgi:hypothetical protein
VCLRFVSGIDSQDGRWLTGVITEAQLLRDEGKLDPYQVLIVEETFEWFNDHIPCPPFQRNLESGRWSSDAVAWFLPTVTIPIQRMWDLVAILENHGVPVRVMRTEMPGLIVYRDEFQVVAETPRRR